MINLEDYLYKKVLPVIMSWDKKEIYAISFLVYANESYGFDNYHNLAQFSVGYNTETVCNNAEPLSEERWNYAFWRKNEDVIIDPCNPCDDGINTLLAWYKENNIENIGYEDEKTMYDGNMKYIGKGAIGYYELLTVVSAVARRLQTEGLIKNKFGKIPIIVHDLEYPWYVEKATKNANPNGEAKVFLKYLKAFNQDFNLTDLLQALDGGDMQAFADKYVKEISQTFGLTDLQQAFEESIQDFGILFENLPENAEELMEEYIANPDSAPVPEFLCKHTEKAKELIRQTEKLKQKKDK